MPKINPRIKSIDDLLGLDAAEESPIEPTPSVSLPTKNTIITLPPQAIRAFRGHPFRLYPMTYPEFQRSLLWELAASLPTPDEWAYLCGGGCRTLFPWGDGLDHKMKLHHFENGEDQGKPYDMEQPNFFGLSIAYDPYKRELVDGKTLTTCGGDGGCNVCGGMGPLLGYLPCSPHCKPEVREDNEIHNDYDFFRPVIRVQTSGWRIVSPENER